MSEAFDEALPQLKQSLKYFSFDYNRILLYQVDSHSMVGQVNMDAQLAETTDNFLEMTKHNSLDPLMLRLY